MLWAGNGELLGSFLHLHTSRTMVQDAMHYRSEFVQIVIHSDNDEFPKLNLTTFGTREVFERLKQVCLAVSPSRSNMIIIAMFPGDWLGEWCRNVAGLSPCCLLYPFPCLQAWTRARIATAVHHGDHDDHHMHI